MRIRWLASTALAAAALVAVAACGSGSSSNAGSGSTASPAVASGGASSGMLLSAQIGGAAVLNAQKKIAAAISDFQTNENGVRVAAMMSSI